MNTPAPLLRLHCLGAWPPGRVTVEWTPSTLHTTPEIDRLIDETWTAAGVRPGIHLFDGPLCRMESFDASPERLRLRFSRTSYKPFLGTNLRNGGLLRDVPAEYLACAVGVSPALISADGYFVMGRRNDKVAFYPEHVHPFSGALEPNDALDVFAEIRRELREELNFADADATDVMILGIAEDVSIRQPELIAACRSRLSFSEISKRLDPAEHVGLWSTPATPDALARVARPGGDATPFTPVARAAMLLWGRDKFGETWFGQTRGAWAASESGLT